MMRSAPPLAVGLALLASSGCASHAPRARSAADAVATYVTAARRNDPHLAYALLARSVRKSLSYREFARQWRDHPRERALQADALEEARKADKTLGTRAIVAYPRGARIALVREDDAWHLQRALTAGAVTATPRDALRAFAAVLVREDVAAFTRLLSKSKREAFTRTFGTLARTLDAHIDHFIQRIGDDRAEMRWEDEDGQYRIQLVREDGQWRVDDFDVDLRDDDDDAQPAIGHAGAGGSGSSGSHEFRSRALEGGCDPADPLCAP